MSPQILDTPSTSLASTPPETPLSKILPSQGYLPATSLRTSQLGSHAVTVLKEQEMLSESVQKGRPVYVDTDYIGVGHVVAVAKHSTRVEFGDTCATVACVNRSVEFLAERLGEGHDLYGITTGFGGSAGHRSSRVTDLQRALIQHQQSGILPVTKQAGSMRGTFNHSAGADYMPEAWVRGAMLIRCKSLLAGHSAVRFEIIELLIALLNANMTPLLPLRGSISASGDLQPLSYVAGVLEGNPDIWVWTSDGKGGRELIPANAALSLLNRSSITFAPKEALGVLNGTAVSTAVAALAMDQAQNLALFSQILTAMGVEAMLGSVGSFNEFFAQVRPHKGQGEVAKNILKFLTGSNLARKEDMNEQCVSGLKQDRYAIRTSSQWMGPQLEDLALAHEQVTVECNSVTDNPLVDIAGSTIHHGGNFQAASITSAMEKTRTALQMFGRMLFSQCTEITNPDLNSGLPPNLAADEPSTSYTMKGADINVAAYMSELAFLANPVSSHVQTAEMGNQAINSLALISARYTHTAIECLSKICAVYLYILCQALDLRAMDLQFQKLLKLEISIVTRDVFDDALGIEEDLCELQEMLVRHALRQLTVTTALDCTDRFDKITESLQSPVTTFLIAHQEEFGLPRDFEVLSAISSWKAEVSFQLCKAFNQNRELYFKEGDASEVLGEASKRMYGFVRNDLAIPPHKGLADHPRASETDTEGRSNGNKTIGTYISTIYESLQSGKLAAVVGECFRCPS